MSGNKSSAPMLANTFHAGNTCPFCQENIAEGQYVVTCNHCSSLHHETCWLHKGGCSSYHCDETVRAQTQVGPAEVVITVEDLKDVRVPPKPQRKSPAEAARPFLKDKPDKLSKMAVLSALMAALSLLGLIGAFGGDSLFTGLGFAFAAAALVTGVVALVFIHSRKKVYGVVPAITSVGVAGIMLLCLVAALDHKLTQQRGDSKVNLRIRNSRPREEDLRNLSPERKKALLNNVVIQSKISLLESATGSGIILKIDGTRAYILTNRHVIGNSDDPEVSILFFNGEESNAQVEWRAPKDIDLAIVSCRALTVKNHEPTALPDQLASQAEKVFAVGNPMNMNWTYTEGVISGIRHQDHEGLEVVIYQTQTPINHGNSGGGLYNEKCELIGINSFTQDKSVAEGISFAISTQSLLELLSDAEKSRFLENGGRPVDTTPGDDQ